MAKILVICTGNTCRSPMAEGVIKKIISDKGLLELSVESRGLHAYDGDAASENAVAALAEIGIDIANHRSKSAMVEDIYSADRIYVMTNEHKDTIISACKDKKKIAGKITVLGISDPFGGDMSKYRECRDRMLEFFERELLKNAKGRCS